MKTRENKKVFINILIILFFVPNLFFAEQFRFKYNKDDSYRILSTVQENVFINGYLDHYAEIVNRISVEIQNVTGNSTEHSAKFMTSEKSTGRSTFSWGNEYHSIFTRDEFGHYIISDKYFMPVVRDVPIFPEQEINIGDTWTAEGHEAHDMRTTFGIDTPFIVPFTATYKYTDVVEIEGKKLHKIDVKYKLYYESPFPKDLNLAYDFPAITMGYSHQTIYWDNEKGAINNYHEDFRIVIETFYGNVFEFNGNAQAEITEFNRKVTDNFITIQDTIKELGIENTSVRSDDTGITISLENIQFKPDSAELLDSEKIKINKISTILKQFPNNDLLISGHTALAGTPEARQELSEQRAQAVAEYLKEIGVKDDYHIFTQGLGATEPVAPNTTEEGKARNRRVEIKILNN